MLNSVLVRPFFQPLNSKNPSWREGRYAVLCSVTFCAETKYKKPCHVLLCQFIKEYINSYFSKCNVEVQVLVLVESNEWLESNTTFCWCWWSKLVGPSR